MKLHMLSVAVVIGSLAMMKARAEPITTVQVKPLDDATVQELRSRKTLYLVSCPRGLVVDYSWSDSSTATVQCVGDVEGVVIQGDGAYEAGEPTSEVKDAVF